MNSSRSAKHAHKAAGILCLCASLIAKSSAQQPKAGQIRIHVVDVLGATIPRAAIFIHRNAPPENSISLAGLSDGRGNFMLTVPEGGYDIIITAPGFRAGVQSLPVFAGKTENAQWKLKVVGCEFPGTNCDSFK